MAHQWRDRLSADRPRGLRPELRIVAVAVVTLAIVWLLFGDRSPLLRFLQAFR
jgi:hypothetical protein